MNEEEKIQQVAQQVTLLIQFAAMLIEDIEMLERVAKSSSVASSSAMTLAPVMGAVGMDYEEAHMEAEVKRKRANAILNLVKVLKETEEDRESFMEKQVKKQEAIAQFRGMGIF